MFIDKWLSDIGKRNQNAFSLSLSRILIPNIERYARNPMNNN